MKKNEIKTKSPVSIKIKNYIEIINVFKKEKHINKSFNITFI